MNVSKYECYYSYFVLDANGYFTLLSISFNSIINESERSFKHVIIEKAIFNHIFIKKSLFRI